jgi:hypothetical protein
VEQGTGTEHYCTVNRSFCMEIYSESPRKIVRSLVECMLLALIFRSLLVSVNTNEVPGPWLGHYNTELRARWKGWKYHKILRDS